MKGSFPTMAEDVARASGACKAPAVVLTIKARPGREQAWLRAVAGAFEVLRVDVEEAVSEQLQEEEPTDKKPVEEYAAENARPVRRLARHSSEPERDPGGCQAGF